MSLFGRVIAKVFRVEYDDSCRTCSALSLELERRNSTVCSSCETLRMQAHHALEREKVLIERLLQLSEPEKIPVQIAGKDNRLNKAMPFRIAQSLREEQDRIAAKKLKDITELERELAIPQTEAEKDAEAEKLAKLEEDKEFAAMAGIEDASEGAESHTA